MLVLTVQTPKRAHSVQRYEKVSIIFPGGEAGTIHFFSSTGGGKLRVGFEMPPDVRVVRGSLVDKVKALEEVG